MGVNLCLKPGEQAGCRAGALLKLSLQRGLILPSWAPLPPKPSGFVEGQLQIPTLIVMHQAWTERSGEPSHTPLLPCLCGFALLIFPGFIFGCREAQEEFWREEDYNPAPLWIAIGAMVLLEIYGTAGAELLLPPVLE